MEFICLKSGHHRSIWLKNLKKRIAAGDSSIELMFTYMLHMALSTANIVAITQHGSHFSNWTYLLHIKMNSLKNNVKYLSRRNAIHFKWMGKLEEKKIAAIITASIFSILHFARAVWPQLYCFMHAHEMVQLKSNQKHFRMKKQDYTMAKTHRARAPHMLFALCNRV